MSGDGAPQETAVPALLLWAAAGIAFGFVVLGRFIRGPGDPSGIIVGPVLGGLVGVVVGMIRRRFP